MIRDQSILMRRRASAPERISQEARGDFFSIMKTVIFSLVLTIVGFVFLPANAECSSEGKSKSDGSVPPLVDEKACNAELIDRLLTVIEKDIVPLTQEGVKTGNRIFGAAIIRKDDHSLVMAGTHHKDSPLYHGEVYTIKKLYETMKRPAPDECIFITTHESCAMCLAAIAWSGFDNIFYLFSYEDFSDFYKTPYNTEMLEEIFRVKNGNYRKKNSFWTSYNIIDLINKCSGPTKEGFLKRVEKLKTQYVEMTEVYKKSENGSTHP